MIPYLSTFSDSFILAIASWPFIAYALTIPVMVIQYRRYNRLRVRRLMGTYLFILYMLGLVSFALYPLPDDRLASCQDYLVSPQLMPFLFIRDLGTDGLRALLPVGMNVVFFVPLGVFAGVFFGWRLRTALIASFFVSMVIETAQLTGGFGLYPCSYRQFNVDDLMINTLGGLLGYVLALALPEAEVERARKGEVIRKAGLFRHTTAVVIDQAVAQAANVPVIFAAYLFSDLQTVLNIRDTSLFVVTFVVVAVIPYIARGWSIGGAVVRLNHDDESRAIRRRTLFYMARAVLLMTILFPPFSNTVRSLAILLVLIVWWRRKKLPYQLL
jgi:glycopeptide antibiotics resistance protein